MMSSQKTPVLKGALLRFLSLQLRHRFNGVHVHGLENLRNLDAQRPTIAFSNHVSWWDAHVVSYLSTQTKQKDFYCMAEEAYLSQFVYLKSLGAFPVDLHNSIKATASIRYALRLLTLKENLLWVFPQGTVRSPYEKIELETETHSFASKVNNAQMLPVAFRYEFLDDKKPHAFIKIGSPFPAIESTSEKIRFSIQCNIDFLEVRCTKHDYIEFEQILSLNFPFQKQWEGLLGLIRRVIDARFSKKPAHQS